jgi:4-hydroxy-tetrahydrodipicolinate reductase
MTLQVAVHGAGGRMGRSVIEVLLADENATLVAAVDRAGHPLLGQDGGLLLGQPKPSGVTLSDDLKGAIERAEVVIDFSLPDATVGVLARCAAAKRAVVVGTTGLDGMCQEALAALARVAPVVAAPNFSVGVNVLWALSGYAVQLLGEEFDVEIVEMHHKHKVDAPSGPAVRLTEVAARVRGLDPEWATTMGRSGNAGPRPSSEIGVHALRGGDVIGDHTLALAGPGERVELTHRAGGREIFARGAVRAAHWVKGKSPGRYEMSDVLGIR